MMIPLVIVTLPNELELNGNLGKASIQPLPLKNQSDESF